MSIKSIHLLNGDCLELMKEIPDGSVDMILCDLPYGVLNKDNQRAKWDRALPFDLLWNEYNRICKENAAICLFGQGMFTAEMMLSNPKMWRYNLIWNKGRVTGFLNANRMPLRCHEVISVFYKKLPVYNPQMEDLNGREKNHPQGYGKHRDNNGCYGEYDRTKTPDYDKKFPRSIININAVHCGEDQIHPTQKPVALCEWLIKTYTNEGNLVLDNCMGSGTTGVACVNTGRNFIGIEANGKYYNAAEYRIKKAQESTEQIGIGI